MHLKLAWNILRGRPGHVLMTIGGTAATTMLILLLFSIYDGMKEGATAYVESSRADLWVLQDNSNNILRSSSHLWLKSAETIRDVEDVDSVSSVLKTLATASIDGEIVTFFFVGIHPVNSMTLPARINTSGSQLTQGGLILETSLARRFALQTGDSIDVQGVPLHITGTCDGTNTMVSQFSFCSYEDASVLLGFPGVVSFFLVKVRPAANPMHVAEAIVRRVPGSAVFTKEQIILNNMTELNTGILPVLLSIALIALAGGAFIVSLLMYGSIADNRITYALLKALGTEPSCLVRLVVVQALTAVALGSLSGLSLAIAVAPLLAANVPSLNYSFQIEWFLAALTITLLFGCIGALAPIWKMRAIDPEEVFRS